MEELKELKEIYEIIKKEPFTYIYYVGDHNAVYKKYGVQISYTYTYEEDEEGQLLKKLYDQNADHISKDKFKFFNYNDKFYEVDYNDGVVMIDYEKQEELTSYLQDKGEL